MANFNEKINCGIEYIRKPVQTETKSKCEQAVDLINDAKRKIESCKNLLDTNAYKLERTSDAIKLALMEIDD